MTAGKPTDSGAAARVGSGVWLALFCLCIDVFAQPIERLDNHVSRHTARIKHVAILHGGSLIAQSTELFQRSEISRNKSRFLSESGTNQNVVIPQFAVGISVMADVLNLGYGSLHEAKKPSPSSIGVSGLLSFCGKTIIEDGDHNPAKNPRKNELKDLEWHIVDFAKHVFVAMIGGVTVLICENVRKRKVSANDKAQP